MPIFQNEPNPCSRTEMLHPTVISGGNIFIYGSVVKHASRVHKGIRGT